MQKRPLGKVPSDAIGTLTLPVITAEIIDGFRTLPDLTGMSSDAMDELGVVGAIPAAVLRPTDPKVRLVGRALTVMNVATTVGVAEAVAGGVSKLGEIEAHNLAEPGDVLVLQGVDRADVCDEVWLAVQASRRSGRERDARVRKLCRRLGFGLLAVSEAGTVDIIASSKFWFKTIY